MRTEPLYLHDSYCREVDAAILQVSPEAPERWRVILDRTIFYPMGGGQPTDQGRMYSNDWAGEVYQVLVKNGEIIHYVKTVQAPPQGSVHLSIDWERRYRNMRVHSAGHVIDFALYVIGLSPAILTPIKADHGKKPSVTYSGIAGDDFQYALETACANLIRDDLEFSTNMVTLDQLTEDAIYIQPNLPTGKPLRMLRLNTIGSVADGGTQVHRTSEVGATHIVRIEQSTSPTPTTVIHYTVD